jgi:methylmalonyl-CoA mutase N-terminal domain/subunit
MPVTGVSSHPDPGEQPLERPVTTRPEVLAAASARLAGRGPDEHLPELLAAVERAAGAGRGDGSVVDAAITALSAGATVGAVAAAIRGRGAPTAIAALPAAREEELLDSLRPSSAPIHSSPEAGGG